MVQEEYVICPLCGYSFAPQKEECFSFCPWGKNCRLVCCPQCHYRFPAESKMVSFFKKILAKNKKEKKENDGECAGF